MEGMRSTFLIFVCGSNGSLEYCRMILVIQVIEQPGNRENSPLNRGGKFLTFEVKSGACVCSSISPWAVRMPINCQSEEAPAMVSWKERYPFLARHRNQLLQKIHKTQEEWDKLWDLLLLLQYPGES
jgi:hypothetical protein